MNPALPAADNDTYDRIAAAIAFLQQHHLDQPDLAAVARHVHLSEYHFQRLFTRWAGISPKRFLQHLTADYAKAKIAETRGLLDLAAAAGLSGPGRLQELFVTLEGMAPGQYRAGGQGLEIRYGLHGSPFGQCLIATTDRGICHLHFVDGSDGANPVQGLRAEWPQAALVADQDGTEPLRDRIFATDPGQNPGPPLTVAVKGTNFQIQVWRALLRIPPGGLITYQGLAAALGRPTAARAVGNAVGRNPVGYLIPCHRVLRESGALGGYRWGLERKAALVGWEAARCQENDMP